MGTWSKRKRFETILAGEVADRPLVSAWRHFVGHEADAVSLADATIRFQQKYDWDFVKINPRATYYGEVWGNTHDYGEYESVLPKLTNYVIHDPSDLSRINADSTNVEPLHEQLDAIRLIRQGLGAETPLIQTLFSPLAVLVFLSGHNPYPGAAPHPDRAASTLRQLIDQNPSGVHSALKQIAHTFAEYVKEVIEAGAAGIFYSIFGFGNEQTLTREEFEEFALPYDLIIFEALDKGYAILHTCGAESNPERFVDYPIHAIHWANQAKGNPSLQSSREWIGNKVAVGGVSEHLFGSSDSSQIQEQAIDSILSLQDRPFILTAGCGLPLTTTEKALWTLRNAVHA